MSVENETFSSRIRNLAETPAQIKFLSVEPLIGPVKTLDLRKIDWVIVGGESGFGARPLKYEWVQFIKEECNKSKTVFFFKQWGKPRFNINQDDPTIFKQHPQHAKGGCQLDGEIFRQMPLVDLAFTSNSRSHK